MGLFQRLISRFRRDASVASVPSTDAAYAPREDVPVPVPVPVPAPAPATPVVPAAAVLVPEAQTPAVPYFSVTVSMAGSSREDIPLNDHDVARAAAQYAFVLDSALPALKAADRWWNERTQKRRLREGSEEAIAWVEPFLPLSLVATLALPSARTERGPMNAQTIAKELRAAIRVRRKAKEPHDELVKALYGACVLADFVQALRFVYVQPHHMAHLLSAADVRRVQLDYDKIGYRRVQALSTTDVKWLVEAFGEPLEHRPVAEALQPLIRSCVSRYCWQELRAAIDYGNDRDAMQKWLAWQVGIRLRIESEDSTRMVERLARLALPQETLQQAWDATSQPFVVADLETTGLRADADEVLEFAAIRAAQDGTIISEFSALVRVARVPTEITALTGITQQAVDQDGQPLSVALRAFAEFIGSHPVFFHNAPFDRGFLQRASEQTGVGLVFAIHDTLPLARQAWPTLGAYKLRVLSAHVGAPPPTHRGLSDARAALAVLMAARSVVIPSSQAQTGASALAD